MHPAANCGKGTPRLILNLRAAASCQKIIGSNLEMLSAIRIQSGHVVSNTESSSRTFHATQTEDVMVFAEIEITRGVHEAPEELDEVRGYSDAAFNRLAIHRCSQSRFTHSYWESGNSLNPSAGRLSGVAY